MLVARETKYPWNKHVPVPTKDETCDSTNVSINGTKKFLGISLRKKRK